MKKLCLFVSLVVIFVSTVSLGVIISKSKVDIPEVETGLEQKLIEEQISTDEVEIIEEGITEQEVASSKIEKIMETKETATTKTETSSPEQEIISSSIPKTKSKPMETIPPKVEEPKVEQDPEYLRLLKQVEYKTYEEAMEAGFAVAEKDTVNIAGFSCPYIVYKGQILGYRLEVTYY